MIPLIDIHAHLDWPNLDIDAVVKKAKENNVITITNGVNPDSNRKCLALAEHYEDVHAALGMYPVDALEQETNNTQQIDIDSELRFIKKNKDKIVALGEVGLDYYNGGKTEEAIEKQKDVFIKFINLAKQIKKPLIIHSRKAEKDVVQILEQLNVPNNLVILHCFSGKKALIRTAIENKWYFTIPTNVVRNESFQWMIKQIDINHLFCETDSPWLSPFGREELNEPANVIESYKMIAKIKEMTLEEVKNNLFMNYQKIFI